MAAKAKTPLVDIVKSSVSSPVTENVIGLPSGSEALTVTTSIVFSSTE